MGSFDVSFVAASYAAYIIIPLVLLLGGYRLLFHPLRKYPGPLLARLTNAYGGYFAIKKRLHLETYQNFQKYGKSANETFRVSSSLLTGMDDRSRRQAGAKSACV